MKGDSKASGALTTIVPAGAAVVVTGLLIKRWLRARKEPPQFSMGLPVVGPMIQFLKEPLELVRRGYKKNGEIFKVNMLALDMIFLVGEEAQKFFFTQDKYLDQAWMYSFTIPIFGKKVLYDVDYSTRTCQLGFLRERLTNECLSSYCATLEDEVRNFFAEEWPGDEGIIDVRKSFIDCLTRTSVRCLMGRELRAKMNSGAKGETIVDLLHDLEQGMLPLSVFLPSAPCPRHWKRDRARVLMQEFLKPIIADRRSRADAHKEGDFLQRLLEGKYPDGTAITDDEIVGFVIAAFFGGMHNSSITTAWSTLEIFSRPELVKELREEQKATIGSGAYTFEAQGKMKKLRSTVTETLRMHPPLMLLMRTVEEDCRFKQYTIPRGSVVVVSPNVGCELEESFPKAAEFQPNRFVNGIDKEFAYIPFGGGRRICKGQEFGYLQIMAVLSHLLQNFELETLDGVTKPTIGEGMVIAPSQPCRVHYRRRSAKA